MAKILKKFKQVSYDDIKKNSRLTDFAATKDAVIDATIKNVPHSKRNDGVKKEQIKFSKY
jgi:hypothetical protein